MGQQAGERVAGRTERHHSDDRVRHQHDEVTHSPLDKTPLVSIEGLPAHERDEQPGQGQQP